MDGITIRRLEPGETALLKNGIQDAFQNGFEDVLGPAEGTVIPERDIDESLDAEGSASYVAVIDGTIVGGAIVVIGPDGHNHLDILYVSKDSQSKGIGYRIWKTSRGCTRTPRPGRPARLSSTGGTYTSTRRSAGSASSGPSRMTTSRRDS